MTMRTSIQGATALVSVQGKFDFTAHQDFRKAFKEGLSDASVREIEIDFRGCNYLDSAALGNLLVSRDESMRAGKTLVLSGVSGAVKQVFDISNFGKIFTFK